MRNLKFPEIEKKVQQSVYGAWGGSNSNDPNGGFINLDDIFIGGDPVDIYLDEVIVGGGGGYSGGGSSGSWDDKGSYDNGGYWGDTGGSGGGASYELGDNFIEANNMLVFAEGHANTQQTNEIEDKIRNAVNAAGLAAGFTGTAMDGLAAITKEIGFTVKTFGKTATGIGAVSVIIGAREVYITAQEISDGKHSWDELDTLNLVSTILGGAALVPGPHSIICGGLSIAIGLVGTAYSQN